MGLGACRGPVAPDWPEGEGLVVVGATVVDDRGARAPAGLLLAGGRIWGEVDPQAAPARFARLDARGLTLVPGLIDSHVHLAHAGALGPVGDTLEQNLRATLAWGVIGAADVGGPLALVALREEQAAGRLLAPRLEVTGPFLTTELGHPCESTWDPALCVPVDGDGRAQAEALRAAGVDRVKVALQDASFSPWPSARLDLADLAAICAGDAIVHVGASQDAADAFAAGCRRLAHLPFGDVWGPAQAGLGWAELHSTRAAFAAVGELLAGADVDAFWATPEVVRADWAAVAANPALLLDGWAEASALWTTQLEASLGVAVQAGAPVLPGSDAGYTFVPHGQALHGELEALVQAGLHPAEALARGTWHAAQARGWEDLGRVEPGFAADLLLLRCDPSADIACTQQIAWVILGGRAYTPEALLTAELRVAPLEGLCLGDEDCAEGVCDRLAHTCVDACAAPYTDLETCGPGSWCVPADGYSSAAGACHADPPCDWRAQDCTPAAYPQTCVPRDWDTAACWPAGERLQGQACGWESRRCAPGLYCSPASSTCLTLCDPAEPTCPGATLCHEIEGPPGEPWFGLCW